MAEIKVNKLLDAQTEELNKKWHAIAAMSDSTIHLAQACTEWSYIQRGDGKVTENELSGMFRESITELFNGLNGLVISGIISQDILTAAFMEQEVNHD